jgi:hypothetical protein
MITIAEHSGVLGKSTCSPYNNNAATITSSITNNNNFRAANNNPVNSRGFRNRSTSAAILQAQQGPIVMNISNNKIFVPGDRALLHNHLVNAIRSGILSLIEYFKQQVKVVETNQSLEKTSKTSAENDKSERITATIDKERSATLKVIGRIIGECATESGDSFNNRKNNKCEDLRRKFQSMEANILNSEKQIEKFAKNGRGSNN